MLLCEDKKNLTISSEENRINHASTKDRRPPFSPHRSSMGFASASAFGVASTGSSAFVA